jgi:hypothetical protein
MLYVTMGQAELAGNFPGNATTNGAGFFEF